MKEIAIAINPLLAHLKYLLLTALLLLLAIAAGQYLLQAFGFDTSLSMNMKESLIPFIGTASISMFLAKKLQRKGE